MKHIHTFNNYIKESEASPLLERTVSYVSDERFKDAASLKADILKNAGPALTKLLKDNGIVYGPLTAKEGRGNRIAFESKPITGKDLGIMMYGLKEVYIGIFSGGDFPQINKAAGEAFEFTPHIWCQLHYSYTHGAPWTRSQGSNGCSLYLPGEDNDSIFYDVVNAKFLKASEMEY
jgi:hypothetical protein